MGRNRLLIAAVFGGLTINPSATKAIEPMSLCAILSHREDYLNRDIEVHGVVVLMQHGGFLQSTSPCEQAIDSAVILEGIDWRAYFAAGGKKGFGVVATLSGRLLMSDRHISHAPPGPHLAFSGKNVRYEKPMQR